MLRRLFLFWLFLSAQAAGAAEPSGQPINISLETIRSDPWKYDGQKVRVRGVFNECMSLTCEFCPSYEAHFPDEETADDAKWAEYEACMGVDFAVDAGENLKSVGGFRLRVAESNLRDLAEENARLTESTLVATYDDGCAIKRDNNTGEEIIPLCTDRGSELLNAVIETVHVRYTGANGPITVYGTEKVVPADEATRTALFSAFNDQIDELAPDLRYFAFLVEGYSDADIAEYNLSTAGVCECHSDECRDDDWPKQVGGTWNLVPANPYYCWPAVYQDDAWRFDTGSSLD